MVVTRHGEDATEPRSPHDVGTAEHIAGSIDARTLAVPDAEDTVDLAGAESMVHLGTPQGSRGQILVQAGLEHDVVRLEVIRSLPELLVIGAQRRSTITRHQACGVQTLAAVQPTLHHGQAHQRLDAGQEHWPFFRAVNVLLHKKLFVCAQFGLLVEAPRVLKILWRRAPKYPFIGRILMSFN